MTGQVIVAMWLAVVMWKVFEVFYEMTGVRGISANQDALNTLVLIAIAVHIRKALWPDS